MAWSAAALIAAAAGPRRRADQAEPKALRYKILRTAASLTRGARRRQLKIQATWSWVYDIVTAFDRICARAHAP